MRYWFRPARFWRCFAFYYPASRKGWVATVILLMVAVAMFLFVKSRAQSFGDILFGFAPWCIALGAVFDLLCFRFGEYPSWWKDKNCWKKDEKRDNK